jgi:hypothetical protein
MSAQRITQANVVIDFAPDLADGVVAGMVPLDKDGSGANFLVEVGRVAFDGFGLLHATPGPAGNLRGLRCRFPRLAFL